MNKVESIAAKMLAFESKRKRISESHSMFPADNVTLELTHGFVGTLMMSKVHMHIYHLQTTSFAVHKATQDYYDNITDKIDTIIEGLQGATNQLFKVYRDDVGYCPEGAAVYAHKLMDFIKQYQSTLPEELAAIKAEIDNVIQMLNELLYKLEHLG